MMRNEKMTLTGDIHMKLFNFIVVIAVATFTLITTSQPSQAQKLVCSNAFKIRTQRISSSIRYIVDNFNKLMPEKTEYSNAKSQQEMETLFSTEFLKIAEKYLIPSELERLHNNGQDRIIISFFAAGSVGKSTLFNSMPFIFVSEKMKTTSDEDNMSPVNEKPGYTKRIIFLHHDSIDPRTMERFRDQFGAEPLSLILRDENGNPILNNGKVQYNRDVATTLVGPHFQIGDPRVFPNLVIGEAPGVNNGDAENELLNIVREAAVRSDILMVYANRSTVADSSIIKTLREVLHTYGRKKLIFAYQLEPGNDYIGALNNALSSLKEAAYHILENPEGLPAATKENTISNAYEKHLKDGTILGSILVPFSAKLNDVDGQIETIMTNDGGTTTSIYLGSKLRRDAPEKFHPIPYDERGSTEGALGIFRYINENAKEIKAEVEKEARDDFKQKTKVIAETAAEMQDHLQLSIETYKAAVAQKVSSAFAKAPIEYIFKWAKDDLYKTTTSAVSRALESPSHMLYKLGAAFKDTVTGQNKKYKLKNAQPEFDEFSKKTADTIDSLPGDVFGNSEIIIQFRQPAPNEIDVTHDLESQLYGLPTEDKTHYLPLPQFFKDINNYKRIYKFIKLSDSNQAAQSPEQAHTWVTTGKNVKISISSNVTRYIVLSGLNGQITKQVIRQVVNKVYNTMLYQYHKLPDNPEQRQKIGEISQFSLRDYIGNQFKKTLQSPGFLKYREQIDNELDIFDDRLDELENNADEMDKEAKIAQRRVADLRRAIATSKNELDRLKRRQNPARRHLNRINELNVLIPNLEAQESLAQLKELEVSQRKNQLETEISELEKAQNDTADRIRRYIASHLEDMNRDGGIPQEEINRILDNTRTDVYRQMSTRTHKWLRNLLKSATWLAAAEGGTFAHMGIQQLLTSTEVTATIANAAGQITSTGLLDGVLNIIASPGGDAAVVTKAATGAAIAIAAVDTFVTSGGIYLTHAAVKAMLFRRDNKHIQLLVYNWYRANQQTMVEEAIHKAITYKIEEHYAPILKYDKYSRQKVYAEGLDMENLLNDIYYDQKEQEIINQ